MKALPIALLPLLALAARAEVAVSALFGSHMVLQRDRPVPVWGKASPGEEVRVSFAGQEVSAKADGEGDWQVALKPLALSKEGCDLVVAGPSNVNVLADVLVGDVWLCSGQSNMEMSFDWVVYGGDDFRAESVRFPTIRRVKIRKEGRPFEGRDDVAVERKWAVASNDFAKVTAAGYFFARRITLETGIPIGLVDASWSAQAIEPFISSAGYRMVPALASFADKIDRQDPKTEKGREAYSSFIAKARQWADETEARAARGLGPAGEIPQMERLRGLSGLYNGMIAPMARFPIKGALWYQGCSNGFQGLEYADKMEGLVLGWRKAWGYDFPFYYVQLASMDAHAKETPAGGTGWVGVREAQRLALRIPKTGMAVAIDIGHPKDIHPKCKLFVGERLALWALAKDYGKDVVFSGPLVKGAVREDAAGQARVRVSFDCTGSGLMAGKKNYLDNSPVEEDPEARGAIKGFSIKDASGEWFYADAAIDGRDVVVSSTNAPNPVAIHYAYRSNPMGACSLYNREGLPASPFRLAVPRRKDEPR